MGRTESLGETLHLSPRGKRHFEEMQLSVNSSDLLVGTVHHIKGHAPLCISVLQDARSSLVTFHKSNSTVFRCGN